jgi:upstream activation factor subunit UAF30
LYGRKAWLDRAIFVCVYLQRRQIFERRYDERHLLNIIKSMAKAAAKPRKANAAFMKPLNVSTELALVVGNGPLPRSEVVKKLWAYIKKNGLQDTKNKRNINADTALKAVFNGKGTVSMFEMTKLVSAHLS